MSSGLSVKRRLLSSLTPEIAFKRRKQSNIYIYLYIYIYFFFAFFPLKKSEQPEIVAFNRIVVNYNIQFFFIGAETTELVLTVVTHMQKYAMEERMILVKVAYGFSSFYGRDTERKQYILHSSIHN